MLALEKIYFAALHDHKENQTARWEKLWSL